ncbi:MAG: HAD-IIIA family hydrolase [Bacteroidetes bacterium]|nr:MAG: HAD-IIIA family hydrolase [Bacteroidota bacterium]
MPHIPFAQIDRSWSLFLDRDGVINERLPGAYVTHWGQFVFLPGVPSAMAHFRSRFGRMVVVTNQQGVGKGLMRPADLAAIHDRMSTELVAAGARLDGIYACPDLRDQPHNCRKPAPALGQQAQRDFPDIDFARTIMVGDTPGDLAFGRNLGMYTVWVSGTEAPPPTELYDLQVTGLAELAARLGATS